MPNPSAWIGIIAQLDVVVDALGGNNLAEITPGLLNAISAAVKANRPAHAPKLTYIYTSGAWVFGDDRTTVVSDSTPVTKPLAIASWRMDLEQRILHNPDFNGVVIRPGLLYGRSGSLFGILFNSAKEGQVKWYGTPGGRWSLVHCDDLADLYRRVAENGPSVHGKVFVASNSSTESADSILAALVKIFGAKGYEYIQPSNGACFGSYPLLTCLSAASAFEEALASTALIRPYLAKTLLGWQPTKASLLDGLETYFAAWQASF